MDNIDIAQCCRIIDLQGPILSQKPSFNNEDLKDVESTSCFLLLWRIAAEIINKSFEKLETATRGSILSSFGIENNEGLNTIFRKNTVEIKKAFPNTYIAKV